MNYLTKSVLFICFLSLCNAQYDALLYDKFVDGERNTASLPASARWFTKMPADSLFAAAHGEDYRLETSLSGIHQFWCHFTEAGSPINLEKGSQLRFRAKIQMLRDSDASWDRGLMFGLFNSMGTRDQSDYIYNSGNRNDDVGFFVITNPGRTTDNYAKICKVAENTASDQFVNYTQEATFTSYDMGLEETDVSFDILRVDGGVEITAVIGPESYIYDEFIPIEEGSDYLEFDTVSLFLDGRAFPADIGAMALDFVGIYLYETDKCSQICGYGDQLSGDINQDCYVNLNDFYIMYQDWLEI